MNNEESAEEKNKSVLEREVPEIEDNPLRELGSCPICRGEVKQLSTARTGKCIICRKEHSSYYYCENGHDFCDVCYGTFAFLKLCSVLKTDSKNPIEILNQMMSTNDFGLRGCVHCAIVPVSVILAYKNFTKITGKSVDIIIDLFKHEVMRAPISLCEKNGTCVIPVACGNSLATILPILDQRYENTTVGKRLKGECITAVEKIYSEKKLDEKTCCKQIAYEEIVLVTGFINRYLWVELPLPETVICGFSKDNPFCKKEACRFFRGYRAKPLNDLF